MLSPKLSAIRSIASKSSFPGNNAAIKAYPGRKSTKGKPRMILIGVSFKGGIKTKGAHKSVKRITSARSRSFGKRLSSILFFGMGTFILSMGEGLRAKGKRFSTVPKSILILVYRGVRKERRESGNYLSSFFSSSQRSPCSQR